MDGDELIRRSYSGPHLTYIKYPKHLRFFAKFTTASYFWPTMRHDSTKYVKKLGLLPPVPAKKDMMIVATDYFTKWLEAEALSSIKEADVKRFIWRNNICRFGWPQSLVTDNGSQFIGRQITAKQSPISSVLREMQGDDQ
ncbi:unnamed protein product, partial [Prunus brigantina]